MRWPRSSHISGTVFFGHNFGLIQPDHPVMAVFSRIGGLLQNAAVRTAGVAAVAVVGVSTLTGCSPLGAEPAPVPPPKPDSQCFTTDSIPDLLNQAFQRHDKWWSGADLTNSFDLGDGRTLWLMGDTFTLPLNADGTRPANSGFLHNTALLQEGKCFRPLESVVDGMPGSWIKPLENDGGYYWPSSAIIEGGQLKVFLAHEYPAADGWFKVAGMDVATLDLKTLEVLSIHKTPADALHLYGIATVQDEHFNYLYGTGDAPKDAHALGKNFFVARTPRGGDFSSYEYWDGHAWQKDPAKAKSLLPPEMSSNMSVSPYQGGYLAVAKKNEFMGSQVVAWWSKHPNGPFKELGPIATPPSYGKDAISYMATLHPEDTGPDGRMVVSWNVNSFEHGKLYEDGNLYRPRFAWASIPPVPGQTSR